MPPDQAYPPVRQQAQRAVLMAVVTQHPLARQEPSPLVQPVPVVQQPARQARQRQLVRAAHQRPVHRAHQRPAHPAQQRHALRAHLQLARPVRQRQAVHPAPIVAAAHAVAALMAVVRVAVVPTEVARVAAVLTEAARVAAVLMVEVPIADLHREAVIRVEAIPAVVPAEEDSPEAEAAVEAVAEEVPADKKRNKVVSRPPYFIYVRAHVNAMRACVQDLTTHRVVLCLAIHALTQDHIHRDRSPTPLWQSSWRLCNR